jgi:hypothetical protein
MRLLSQHLLHGVRGRLLDHRGHPLQPFRLDFINLDEEVDPKEREFEPETEPEMPPAHFAHGSTGAGYEAGLESWGMLHNDSLVGNSLGWHFGEYMGMAGDPIPCDSEHEVTSQF